MNAPRSQGCPIYCCSFCFTVGITTSLQILPPGPPACCQGSESRPLGEDRGLGDPCPSSSAPPTPALAPAGGPVAVAQGSPPPAAANCSPLEETGDPVLNPVQFDQLCCSDHIPQNCGRHWSQRLQIIFLLNSFQF